MSSKPGWILARVIAAPIARVLERGSPLAVSIGALSGASIGGGLCLWKQFIVVVGLLIGAIIGAIAGALIFKRRIAEQPEDAAELIRTGGIGEKRYVYLRRDDENEVASACVVCDHALVSFHFLAGHFSPGGEFERFQSQLDRPSEIDLTKGTIVPIAAIESFELAGPDAVVVHWESRGERWLKRLMFTDIDHRNELLSLMSQRHGSAFGEERRPLSTLDNLLAPGIVAPFLMIPAGLAIWFAEYWRQHPPAPPLGKDVDPLVALLTRLGPWGVFPWACLVASIPVLWIAWRIFDPLECDVLVVGPVNTRWSGRFPDAT